MPEVLGASTDKLELALPAAPSSVATARHVLSTYAERCGWTDLWPIQTAVSEAVGNAVLHAYPKSANGRQVWVSAEVDRDGLLVAVEDEGTGMRPRVDSPGLGLGISLIERLTDRLVMEDRRQGGLRVQFRFEREPQAVG
jgi:anti-sigma regulatory factor (Ser/Thr protein kinase)